MYRRSAFAPIQTVEFPDHLFESRGPDPTWTVSHVGSLVIPSGLNADAWREVDAVGGRAPVEHGPLILSLKSRNQKLEFPASGDLLIPMSWITEGSLIYRKP